MGKILFGFVLISVVLLSLLAVRHLETGTSSDPTASGHAATETGAQPRKSSDSWNSDPRTRDWNELPPARVMKSSDDCIGYCFEASIHSVSDADRHLARVVIAGNGGEPARALVHRRRPYGAFPDTSPVRFTCFDKSYVEGVPRLYDCNQMAAVSRQSVKPRTRSNRRTPGLNEFDMLDPDAL